jgi:DNA polymerase/3'-5' exonuclease PolX
MKHAEALRLGEGAMAALTPFCERLGIAGSIRRQKPEVKDIERVCMPRLVPAGLFGDTPEVNPDFCAIIQQWTKVKGEPTGRYTQRVLPGGMTLDMFMADADNWGLQLAIRTGSAAFSHHVLARTWVAQGYTSVEGCLRQLGKIIPIREEPDLFALLGLPWMEPSAREV